MATCVECRRGGRLRYQPRRQVSGRLLAPALLATAVAFGQPVRPVCRPLTYSRPVDIWRMRLVNRDTAAREVAARVHIYSPSGNLVYEAKSAPLAVLPGETNLDTGFTGEPEGVRCAAGFESFAGHPGLPPAGQYRRIVSLEPPADSAAVDLLVPAVCTLELTGPDCGSVVRERSPVLTWSNRTPDGAILDSFSVVVARKHVGQSREEAIRQNVPLLESHGLSREQWVLTDSAGKIEPGSWYAWQVSGLGEDGRFAVSEPRVFLYDPTPSTPAVVWPPHGGDLARENPVLVWAAPAKTDTDRQGYEVCIFDGPTKKTPVAPDSGALLRLSLTGSTRFKLGEALLDHFEDEHVYSWLVRLLDRNGVPIPAASSPAASFRFVRQRDSEPAAQVMYPRDGWILASRIPVWIDAGDAGSSLCAVAHAWGTDTSATIWHEIWKGRPSSRYFEVPWDAKTSLEQSGYRGDTMACRLRVVVTNSSGKTGVAYVDLKLRTKP